MAHRFGTSGKHSDRRHEPPARREPRRGTMATGMEAMWNGTTRHAWIRHLLVAALYAVGYVLLRSVSVSNWNLPAGLRLVCLLLVPYRYWPALIVGEAIPVGYQALDCQHLFGWTWT